MRILLLLVGCLSMWALFFATDASAADDWKAGAAKIVITPDAPMMMAGYASRDRPAEGKLTELWAKALALEDADKERLLLVTLDLVGIDRALSQQICESLMARHNLQRSRIALCCSHTHTGPVVGVNLAPMHYYLFNEAQRRQVDEYTQLLQKKIAAVVEQAFENLQPAQAAWTSGKATFAVNRRNNRASEVPQLRKEGNLRGPFDHDVPVLAVRSPQGRLQAVVFGYACHATTLSSYEWSGDYPGFAQQELEDRHDGCVALFWAGCGGDQNPLPRRRVELAKEYGRRLADAVDEALAAGAEPISAETAAAYQEIDLPLGPLPSRDEIEQDAQSSNRYVASRAKSLLKKLESGPLAQTYPYPVQTWKLGDQIEWFFLGGEVVVDYALRLKSDGRDEQTWVAGYANDVMAYIPSRRVLREGGYEGGGAMVYYGLPTVWAPEVEQMIVSETQRQSETVKQ